MSADPLSINENACNTKGDNPNGLIVVEESTKYFSASSICAQYSDGLEHNFLPPDRADTRQIIEFGDGGIGKYLSFFFNFTNGEDELLKEWYGYSLKHQTQFWLELLPKGWESDYDWQWKISQSWATSSTMRWELLEVGWKASGLAALPRGDWDALYCDSMEFNIRKKNTDRLTLKNVTVGAYLPEGFRSDDLRVYSPCGEKMCHIIDNQVFCRGFGRPDPVVILLIVFVCLLCIVSYNLLLILLNLAHKKITYMRVAAVDQELLEMARLREEAWELRHDEESKRASRPTRNSSR